MTVLLRSFAAFAAALALFALTSAPMRAGDDVPSLGSKVVIDLPDEQGKLIRTEDLSGKWLLVFFGYTSCPDICPTTLFEVAETLKQLGDLAKKIQPIFISIDPDRDQPRQLREYVNSFDSRILPLAGSPDRTARSAQSFGVSYFKVPGLRTGDYTIAVAEAHGCRPELRNFDPAIASLTLRRRLDRLPCHRRFSLAFDLHN